MNFLLQERTRRCRTQSTITCITTLFLLFAAPTAQTLFRSGQNVVLKAPAGYNRWVLAETCTAAWLLATNEKTRESVAGKIRNGALPGYEPDTQAVIQEMDEDGYCALVGTAEKRSGWVHVSLMELTAAEKTKIESANRAAEAKRLVEQQRLAGQHAAEQRRLADQHVAEQRRLSAFPRLVSSAESVIVAVDEGCFKDVRNLKTLGGIELRKRIADLVLYKCVFFVPSGTHVEASKLGNDAYRVVVQEGADEGRAGIVGAEFMQR